MSPRSTVLTVNRDLYPAGFLLCFDRFVLFYSDYVERTES